MTSLIEEEYEAFTRDHRWKLVYDRIRNEATLLHQHPIKVARLPHNRERNRYRDVSPYDDYRVHLQGCENDYINASLVKVPRANRTYILTQGPLANTASHFWLMVWQQNSKGVLMLNKVVEDGRLKCYPYFPIGSDYGGEDALEFPDVKLRVDFIDQSDHGYYVKRHLKICNTETLAVRDVYQFHYVAWPDFGIPDSSQYFLSFLYAVRQSGVIPSPGSKDCGPPVIHCSAGIGRSGTFCLVDSALVLVEKTKSLNTLDVRSMLMDMRQYRCGLIQTAEQLKFSYMAIIDGAHEIISHANEESSAPTEGDIDEEEGTASETGSEEDLPTETDSEGEYEHLSDNRDTETYEKLLPPSDSQKDLNGVSTEGPQPPIRTSSLEAEDQPAAESQPSGEPHSVAGNKRKLDDDLIETMTSHPQQEHNGLTGNNVVPAPPKRTSSLHKAASLDNSPPPVPPRPPHTMNRQVSAPPIPDSSSSKSENQKHAAHYEEEEGYVNYPTSPLQQKRAEAREERKRKTKELVENMKAKQKAAENASHSWYNRYYKVIWAGAAVTAVIAVGFVYLKPLL